MSHRAPVAAVVAGIVLGLCLPAAAHHGAAGLFDVTRTVEVTGSVKRWSFVNPHPILVIEAAGDGGAATEWDIYFGPAGATSLRNRGYAPDTFAVGDTLVVTGHPARADGAHAVDVFGREAGITRADGTSVP
ncbi:MAG: DUF6152 family protein [Acidobacteria bacterium]|nr:DUF6152 family protein [Acidobacteriota bacterium]